MNKVLALTSVAIRNALRSRVVVTLLVMLLLVMIGLPLTVKSDGTVAGHVQIVLGYTLGFASFILSMATLWAGCAAVSLEVEKKQIHMVVTKPVRRGQIWLGKWLGLVLVNAVLLAVCGLVTYALLRWTTRPGQLSAEQQRTLREQILVAQRETLAPVDDVEEAARRAFAERRARGEVTGDLPVGQQYEQLRQSLLAQAYSVPTGGRRRWVFRFPSRPNPDRPMFLRFQFSSSSIDKEPVAGVWVIGPPDARQRLGMRQVNAPGGLHTIAIPPAAVAEDLTLTVDYGNVNPVPVTVLFAPNDGVRVLTFVGSFEGNLARSLLVVFFHLALLSAVGVTAGTLWSMPVAGLVAAYIMILLGVGRYVESADPTSVFAMTEMGPGVMSQLLPVVAKASVFFVKPLLDPSPLESLATGHLVAWTWVGSAFAIKVVLYSGGLGLLAAWLFERKEIGLPS